MVKRIWRKLWTLRNADIHYRGWKARPFIRLYAVEIGTTRLYCVGPLAIFIDLPKKGSWFS